MAEISWTDERERCRVFTIGHKNSRDSPSSRNVRVLLYRALPNPVPRQRRRKRRYSGASVIRIRELDHLVLRVVDLDKMLLPASKKESAPLDPKAFAGLRGHATVKIGSLRKSRLEFSNVVADVSFKE